MARQTYAYIEVLCVERMQRSETDLTDFAVSILSDGVSSTEHPELASVPSFSKVTDAYNYFGGFGWELDNTLYERRYREIIVRGIMRKPITSSTNVILVNSADLAFGTTSPLDIGEAVPADSRILSVEVFVTTAFNGSAPTLSIGTAADPDQLATTAQITLGTAGRYEVLPTVVYASETQIIGTYVADSSTEGAAQIVIRYI